MPVSQVTDIHRGTRMQLSRTLFLTKGQKSVVFEAHDQFASVSPALRCIISDACPQLLVYLAVKELPDPP